MFYPTEDIDELMPDRMINEVDSLLESPYKTRIGYFTKCANSFKNADFMLKQNKELENNALEQSFEGTKGNLPSFVTEHISIFYSYRGENLMLNGLDDSMQVNNGSWMP